MKKNESLNQGIPLFIDKNRDLSGIPGASFDSFFIFCEFADVDGKRCGIIWHQQMQLGKFMTAQILLVDALHTVCRSFTFSACSGTECYIAKNKLECVTPLGELSGNGKEMRLVLHAKNMTADMILHPKKMTLYHGTTGLLLERYQFSFPDMDVSGSLTLDEKTYILQNTTAWFDHQWSFTGNLAGTNCLRWLRTGFLMDKACAEAISLWDVYAVDGRYCFGTVYNKDGTQVNHKAEIEYNDIWVSEKSGYRYPRAIHVEVPTADISFDFTILSGNLEFCHLETNLSGFETLCKIDGMNKGQRVDRYGFLEIVGDVCGEV